MLGTPYEDFLGSVIGPLLTGFPAIVFGSRLSQRICLPGKTYLLKPTHPVVGWLTLLRLPLGDNAPPCVKHAASDHSEPGSNSPLKRMRELGSTCVVSGSTRIRYRGLF